MTHILIVDDHPLLALGLTSALQGAGHVVDHLDPADEASVITAVTAGSPDLVVLDFELPGIDQTADLVASLCHRSARAQPDIVMLSGSADDRGLAECLEAGAIFVIDKAEPIDSILGAISLAAARASTRTGDTAARLQHLAAARTAESTRLMAFENLTPRESSTLAALCAGESPQDIASSSFVALSTVRTHIKSVLRKLEVNSQLEAVAFAHRSGWLALQGDLTRADC